MLVDPQPLLPELEDVVSWAVGGAAFGGVLVIVEAACAEIDRV